MVALAVALGMAAARLPKSDMSAMQLSCDLAFRVLVETESHLSVCRFQSRASAWTACQWLPANTASGSRWRRTSASLTVVLRQLHAAGCWTCRSEYSAGSYRRCTWAYRATSLHHCPKAKSPASHIALHVCWASCQVSHIFAFAVQWQLVSLQIQLRRTACRALRNTVLSQMSLLHCPYFSPWSSC